MHNLCLGFIFKTIKERPEILGKYSFSNWPKSTQNSIQFPFKIFLWIQWSKLNSNPLDQISFWNSNPCLGFKIWFKFDFDSKPYFEQKLRKALFLKSSWFKFWIEFQNCFYSKVSKSKSLTFKKISIPFWISKTLLRFIFYYSLI